MSENWTDELNKIQVPFFVDVYKIPVIHSWCVAPKEEDLVASAVPVGDSVAFLVCIPSDRSAFTQLKMWLPRTVKPDESFMGVNRFSDPTILFGQNLDIKDIEMVKPYTNENSMLVMSKKNWEQWHAEKDNVFFDDECPDDEAFLLDRTTWSCVFKDMGNITLGCGQPNKNIRFRISEGE